MNNEKIIIANWKMNPATLSEAKSLFDRVKKEAKKIRNIEVVIAPPAVWLSSLKIYKSEKINLAAQNMSWEEKGAFTGEISSLMLKDIGINFVILGHSERRIYFGENNEMINAKIFTAFKNNLAVVLCVGETLQEKREENTQEIIEVQIKKGLENISSEQIKANQIIIAYEPVWAIGSGLFPAFDDILSAKLLIKKSLAALFSREIAERVPILYGGSVDELNAKDIICKGDMDGLLIGGISLKANEFTEIMKAVSV